MPRDCVVDPQIIAGKPRAPVEGFTTIIFSGRRATEVVASRPRVYCHNGDRALVVLVGHSGIAPRERTGEIRPCGRGDSVRIKMVIQIDGWPTGPFAVVLVRLMELRRPRVCSVINRRCAGMGDRTLHAIPSRRTGE